MKRVTPHGPAVAARYLRWTILFLLLSSVPILFVVVGNRPTTCFESQTCIATRWLPAITPYAVLVSVPHQDVGHVRIVVNGVPESGSRRLVNGEVQYRVPTNAHLRDVGNLIHIEVVSEQLFSEVAIRIRSFPKADRRYHLHHFFLQIGGVWFIVFLSTLFGRKKSAAE